MAAHAQTQQSVFKEGLMPRRFSECAPRRGRRARRARLGGLAAAIAGT